MRIRCEQLFAAQLRPGDLFSTAGPEYWAAVNGEASAWWPGRGPGALGERIYVRLDTPTPPDQELEIVYKITIELDAPGEVRS